MIAVPPAQQPLWLRQLHQVVRIYPVDPDTGNGAALCRWCDRTWPLPLARLEAEPLAKAAFLLGVAEHGMQHALNGEVRLDAAGEPLDVSGDPLDDGHSHLHLPRTHPDEVTHDLAGLRRPTVSR